MNISSKRAKKHLKEIYDMHSTLQWYCSYTYTKLYTVLRIIASSLWDTFYKLLGFIDCDTPHARLNSSFSMSVKCNTAQQDASSPMRQLPIIITRQPNGKNHVTHYQRKFIFWYTLKFLTPHALGYRVLYTKKFSGVVLYKLVLYKKNWVYPPVCTQS